MDYPFARSDLEYNSEVFIPGDQVDDQFDYHLDDQLDSEDLNAFYDYFTFDLDNSSSTDTDGCQSNPPSPSSPPSSSPHSLEIPQMSEQNINRKRNDKRVTYGKGCERKKIEKMAHHDQPYKDRDLYKLLGSPSKDQLNELGNLYNSYFTKNKYGRIQRRNKTLAYWFFEEKIELIYPWLRSIGKIP